MDDVDFKESTVNPNITVSTWDDDQMGKEMERREAYKEEEVNEEQRINKGKRLFCLTLISNIWFLIGTIFYVWLAVLDLQWEKQVVDLGIPDWVLVADDDHSWEEYPAEDA